MAAELVDLIPLSQDADGVYRIGGTRVTLDLVVRAFNRGATPEEIAQAFPSLQLAHIYQVIGYYLQHGDQLAGYFKRRAKKRPTYWKPTATTGLLPVFATACWPGAKNREMARRRRLP